MKVDILGVQIDKLNFSETIAKIDEFANSENQHQVISLGTECLMLAQKDEKYKKLINEADLVSADGTGLLWAAKYLSLPVKTKIIGLRWIKAILQAILSLLSLVVYPRYCRGVLPEKVPGADLIWSIARISSEHEHAIFLLGASEGIARKAGERLKNSYPKLWVSGSFSGSAEEVGDKVTTSVVDNKKPDILLVAYGAPKQDFWIKRNLEKMPSIKVAMGLGGAFDFIAGSTSLYGQSKSAKTRRAPKILRKIGLEWFWRLITQPRRWRRIWNTVPVFIWTVIKWKVEQARND